MAKKLPNALRQVELLLRIAAKLCLLAPILLGMVWFNFKVDRSGLFREAAFEQSLAGALLAGENLYGFEKLDERALLADYVTELTEAPNTLALGSSRILQMGQDFVDTGSFFNCGMTSADFRDLLASFYLFDKADMLPDNLVISLDAWLFNPAPDAYTRHSDEALYGEFVQQVLGIDVGYTPPEESEETAVTRYYEALVSPSYFQGSLSYWLRTRGQTEIETAQQDLPIVQGDLYNQATEVKLSDGSVLYTPAFRSADQEEINARARTEAGTFAARHGFAELDPSLVQIFESFISYAQARGVNLIFVLVPYHPLVYNYATENGEEFAGFFAAEYWYIDFATENNIPLYGSYNPFVAGCTEADFYDGLHITAEALADILPTTRSILSQQRAGRAGSPWLHSGVRITHETAEAMVAGRYEIAAPHVLTPGKEESILGGICYVFERYEHARPGATLLARYAVTQREGIVYRYDTNLDAWVVDDRF